MLKNYFESDLFNDSVYDLFMNQNDLVLEFISPAQQSGISDNICLKRYKEEQKMTVFLLLFWS